MLSLSNEVTERCRRQDCVEAPLARGLCAPHWARWQDGEDSLDLATDDRMAPPPEEWHPLPR